MDLLRAQGEAIARLERKVDLLTGGRERRRKSNPEAQLLTKRAAARLLGVDRATTLEQLLRAGTLRAVEVQGRTRIPATEIERVMAEGLPTQSRRPGRLRSQRKPAPTGRALSAAFDALEVGD